MTAVSEVMIFTPTTLFVPDPPLHTRQMVEVLRRITQTHESDLLVFLDTLRVAAQAEVVRELWEYIRAVIGFTLVSDQLQIAESRGWQSQ